MDNEKYPLLNRINSPADLKAMPAKDMPALCDEIRSYLSSVIMQNGGHLASNLGAVELTVAIHRVFDTPDDRVIFDVGHQSYVHKLLTGRRAEFETIRRPGGLSGYTRRDESEYDAFGTGHSSTSISAALGFAEADRIAGRDNFTLAVIGDGALTGGMAYEALNNCDKNLRLIIVLNENEMSISRNIGGFANYIAKIRSSPRYLQTKQRTQATINKIPLIGDGLYNFMRDTKQTIKNAMYSSNFFEELGLFYLGPADGNNYKTTERLLTEAKNKGESVIIHLKTKKGLGYPPAEASPNKYHVVPPAGTPKVRNFSAEAGRNLVLLAASDKKICAVTASMCESTGLSQFAKRFPDRFFDVGIAEEHALTFSAGLAAAGDKPYFAVYSSFLQRGYDSVLHDIALQNLPVTVLVDRAGLNAADGPTHHGVFDVAFLSQIPNTTVYSPASFASLADAITVANNTNSPVFIRYPNCGENKNIINTFFSDESHAPLTPRADYKNPDGLKCVIVTYGRIAAESLKAADALCDAGIRTGVVLLESLRPYDKTAEELLPFLPDGDCLIIFHEEGIRNGGAGMLLADALNDKFADKMKNKKTALVAINDRFIDSKSGKSIFEAAGIAADDVVNCANKFICGGVADE